MQPTLGRPSGAGPWAAVLALVLTSWTGGLPAAEAAPPASSPVTTTPASPAEGAPVARATTVTPTLAPVDVQARVKAKRARRYPFSFGLLLGHPPGLQFQARILPAHAVVGQLSYDPFYRGMTANVDYRFSFLDWEFIRYDAVLEVWAGAGVRASFFEPRFGVLPVDRRRAYQRELPVAPGVQIPMGATLKLTGLPMELGLNATLLSFDVYQLAVHVPRWRPVLGLETRVYLPVQM